MTAVSPPETSNREPVGFFSHPSGPTLPRELEAKIFGLLGLSGDMINVACSGPTGRAAIAPHALFWGHMAKELRRPLNHSLTPYEFVRATVQRVKSFLDRGYFHGYQGQRPKWNLKGCLLEARYLLEDVLEDCAFLETTSERWSKRNERKSLAFKGKKMRTKAFDLAKRLANDPTGNQLALFCPWVAADRENTTFHPLPGLTRERVKRLKADAIKAKDPALLDLALRYGAQFPAQLFRGSELLPKALRNDEPRWLQSLLLAGRAAGLQASYEADVLCQASFQGLRHCVNAILALGTDVNQVSLQGELPLTRAAIAGHTEILCDLIEAGADVNARASKDGSPVVEAMRNGNWKCLEILAQKGADLSEVPPHVLEQRSQTDTGYLDSLIEFHQSQLTQLGLSREEQLGRCLHLLREVSQSIGFFKAKGGKEGVPSMLLKSEAYLVGIHEELLRGCIQSEGAIPLNPYS